MNPLPTAQAAVVPHCLPAEAPWPTGVQALFTTRQGGHSQAPYDSWNLGNHVGDAPEHVARNRQVLAERIGARPVFLNQVHGCDVRELTPGSPDGLTADACWSATPGVACTAMVADCLPVLFCSADGGSVGAVHAGWRGLLGQGGRGVIEALCEHWPAALTPAQRSDILVWLGPCIGPEAFEVGPEVRQAFVADQPAAAMCFVPVTAAGGSDKYLANLPQLARQRLTALGFSRLYGNDGSAAWCTVQQASRFFSHRRDSVRLGGTGRMVAAIWR